MFTNHFIKMKLKGHWCRLNFNINSIFFSNKIGPNDLLSHNYLANLRRDVFGYINLLLSFLKTIIFPLWLDRTEYRKTMGTVKCLGIFHKIISKRILPFPEQIYFEKVSEKTSLKLRIWSKRENYLIQLTITQLTT